MPSISREKIQGPQVASFGYILSFKDKAIPKKGFSKHFFESNEKTVKENNLHTRPAATQCPNDVERTLKRHRNNVVLKLCGGWIT